MSNKRNTRTTHPRKSARRERALQRLSHDAAPAHERAALEARIGKPPRAWPTAQQVKDALELGAA